mgnify:CR=1
MRLDSETMRTRIETFIQDQRLSEVIFILVSVPPTKFFQLKSGALKIYL